MYCYHARLQEVHLVEKGRSKLAIGCARITSRTTRGQLNFNFAALYLGDHKLVAGIRPRRVSDGLRSFVELASAAFSAGDLARCSLLIDQQFRGATYSLKSLFRDERQRIVKRIVNSTLADIDEIYAQVYEQHASLAGFLSELQIPMPAILRVSADFVLGNAIQRCLADEQLDIDRIRGLLDTARQDAISLAGCSLEPALRQRLEIVLDRWAKNPFDLSKLGELEAVASIVQVPPFHVDLWQVQNVYYELLQVISREQHVEFSGKWLGRFEQLGELLGVAVGESLLARGSRSLEVEPAYPTSELVQDAGAVAAADAAMISSHGFQMPAGPGMTSA